MFLISVSIHVGSFRGDLPFGMLEFLCTSNFVLERLRNHVLTTCDCIVRRGVWAFNKIVLLCCVFVEVERGRWLYHTVTVTVEGGAELAELRFEVGRQGRSGDR